jgi:predicted nucleic-acid-binding protein
MRAVDANALIRLITRDDPRQTAAADGFVAKGAWVPLAALAEATWDLSAIYERSASGIATAVEMQLSQKDPTLQDLETVAAALDLFRSRPSLGYSGCLILESVRKAGHMPPGAFERALSRVEGVQRL